MTHYVGFVLTNDPSTTDNADIEAQLKKYEESEVEPWLKEIDPSMEIRGLKRSLGREPTHEELKKRLEEWYDVVEYIDGKWKHHSTSNPVGFWDWYVIGGRWTNWLQSVRGGFMVFGRVKDFDFEQRRHAAAEESAKRFAVWRECFEGADSLPKSWTEIHKEIGGQEDPNTIDLCKARWRNQPAISLYSKRVVLWECPVEGMGFDEPVYIEKCRDEAGVAPVLVKDGIWRSREKFGWFGTSTEVTPTKIWNQQVKETLAANPDMFLAVVDFHT